MFLSYYEISTSICPHPSPFSNQPIAQQPYWCSMSFIYSQESEDGPESGSLLSLSTFLVLQGPPLPLAGSPLTPAGSPLPSCRPPLPHAGSPSSFKIEFDRPQIKTGIVIGLEGIATSPCGSTPHPVASRKSKYMNYS